VLCRWFSPSSATPGTSLDITWLDVPTPEAQGPAFSLATAIAEAATGATRGKS
jgi:hypothetical protein